VATIRDIRSPWRDALLPAHFDGNAFHVQAEGIDGGRRIVNHVFPKKDFNYAEDMGRSPFEVTVRGYCITYPYDTNEPLYSRDYRLARDALRLRLDAGGSGLLQLPTLIDPLQVVCPRYRLTEEERFGGFCVFDMTFLEAGIKPYQTAPDARSDLNATSQALAARVSQILDGAKYPGGTIPKSGTAVLPTPHRQRLPAPRS
jgi:prophage DNA circulation protein